MKKIAMISLGLLVACLSAFATCTDIPNPRRWEVGLKNLRVVQIADLTNNGLTEIIEGHHPEIAIEFSARSTFPIKLFLKGDLVHLIENEKPLGMIEIKQTFYVRSVEKELIFSVNLIDWKVFPEFITGNASIALTIHDGEPSITLGSETNRRL